jgi:hypothetical protein
MKFAIFYIAKANNSIAARIAMMAISHLCAAPHKSAYVEFAAMLS